MLLIFELCWSFIFSYFNSFTLQSRHLYGNFYTYIFFLISFALSFSSVVVKDLNMNTEKDYKDENSSKKQSSTNSSSVNSANSSAFALMDVLYSTLVVLQYPMRDPTIYGNVKGKNWNFCCTLEQIWYWRTNLLIFSHSLSPSLTHSLFLSLTHSFSLYFSLIIGHTQNHISDTHIDSTSRSKVHRTTGRGMLLPIHFACDLKELGQIAGNEGTNQFFQFRRMASVCIWLLSRLGGECEILVVRKSKMKWSLNSSLGSVSDVICMIYVQKNYSHLIFYYYRYA